MQAWKEVLVLVVLALVTPVTCISHGLTLDGIMMLLLLVSLDIANWEQESLRGDRHCNAGMLALKLALKLAPKAST